MVRNFKCKIFILKIDDGKAHSYCPGHRDEMPSSVTTTNSSMARKTLAEQIATLSQPKTDYDIENNELENDFDGSGSENLGNSDDEHARDHYVKVSKSKLRKPTSAIRGKKYNGEVVSREALYKDDESQPNFEDGRDDDASEEDLPEGMGEEDLVEEYNADSIAESDSGASLRSNSDEENSASDEEASEEEVSSETKRSRIKQILAHERKHIVNRLSDSATNDALKGYAVLQQQKQFDAFIDLRLKIQKALNTANLLPVDSDTLKNADVATSKSSSYIKEATEKCFDLLDSILDLRSHLYTKDNIATDKFEAKPQKRSLAEYIDATAKYDSVLNNYRGSVLTKWLAKIQNSSGSNAMNAGKFKVINQSAEQQVTSNLYDMDRLMKRTKLNRRQIKPLGHEYNEKRKEIKNAKQSENEDDLGDESNTQSRSLNLQEAELIFDDEDFYRVLLNDLVDKKIQSSDPTSGLQFALKGAASTKLKKNVDNKASKGRKLRYHVQEKIANFDSPRPWLKWNDSQVDEFFASLLGQKISMKEASSDEDDDEDDEEAIEVDTGIKLFG